MTCRRAAFEKTVGVVQLSTTSSAYKRGPFVARKLPDMVAVSILPPFVIVGEPTKAEEQFPSRRGTGVPGKFPIKVTVWFCGGAAELRVELRVTWEGLCPRVRGVKLL